jgi:diguanylate cyclase (GGDEF)-like protein
MTALSDVATRLARARTVEACARACGQGIALLFPQTIGRVYLERKRGELKLVSEEADDEPTALGPLLADAAAEAFARQRVIHHRRSLDGTTLHLVGIALGTRGKAFGGLVAGRQRAFNEDDVHVVELLAHSAAVAIANARLYQETRRLAITDPTTGLFNFRHFRAILPQEVHKARRLGYPIAVIMADIDHFKAFNDAYGHLNGNSALQVTARAVVKSLRQTDTVARYGGEEFAAILPGCDREALARVAEKIRRSVSRAPIRVPPLPRPVNITISVGGAWQDWAEADSASLLSAADEALYVAKESGRDRAHIRQ